MMLALLVLAVTPQTGVVVVEMSTCCRAEAWPEAERALEAELRSAGLAVEVVVGTATGERERRIELGVLAEEKQAACAVRISRPASSSAIEMWVSDRVTGKVLFREIGLGSTTDQRASARLVALRALEAIRASLLELQLAPPARPDLRAELAAVEPPAPTPPASQETFGPWWLSAAGGAQGGPGGAGASAQLGLALRWEPVEHFSVTLDTTLSVFGGGVTSQGLRSSFETAHLRFLGGWEPWTGRFRSSLVVLLGAAFVFAEGLGMQGVSVRRDHGFVAMGGAGLRLVFDVSPRLRLFAIGTASFYLPQVRVLFAETLVATVGVPLIEGRAGFEVSL